MSYMDLDLLSKPEIVTQFIMQRRGKGLCLSYKEYSYINDWLEHANQDENKLLLILSDVIPEAKSDLSGRTVRPLPLSVYNNKVIKRLEEVKFPSLA